MLLNTINFKDIKKRSEISIKKYGGAINPNLPLLDRTLVRSQVELAERSSILYALLMISFQAPISLVKEWIENNNLSQALSEKEKAILVKKNSELTNQETINLSWHIQPLYTLMWVGSLYNTISLDTDIPDTMAAKSPDMANNTNNDIFFRTMRIRKDKELFSILDFYYRAHWYSRHLSLNNSESNIFNQSTIMERRKALEWVCDNNSDWDEIDLST